jgi:hypothetical protein
VQQLHHKSRYHQIAQGKSRGVSSYFAAQDAGKPLFPIAPRVSGTRRAGDASLLAPAPVGDRAPLGKITKSDYKDVSAASKRQSGRYDLQDVARRLLPGSRVANCSRSRLSAAPVDGQHPGVHVVRSESGGCHYSGLQVCGSVWVCPVCAAKISEHRRLDLVQGVQRWRDGGGVVSMLTLTAPHWIGSDLVALLASQSLALKRFWADRRVRAVLSSMGVVGRVRALEPTHGLNGWHPHYHILVFGARLGDADDCYELYQRWAHCCELAGLARPSESHGLRLHDGTYAAAYASKWGIEHELTKGHIKVSKAGATPFDLVRRAQTGDVEAGRLFAVYASAFKGRRQLGWTKGLRALLGLGVELDDQDAAELTQPGELVGRLTYDQWSHICRAHERGALLAAAAISWQTVLDRWPAIFGSR